MESRLTRAVAHEFFAGAEEMRAVYDERVAPARTADPRRFAWDYWHVAGQYTYFRTPARHFFPPALFRRFEAELRGFGDERLGCPRVSEPWLSFYVDGCRQELHADVPQGPWAFVFSLTQWAARSFEGGETLLLRDAVLDYWSGFDPERPLERDDLVERLPAPFGQLLVFDARVPHGVATVEGTLDPTRARVVVHGWFLPPDETVAGGLSRADAGPALIRARALCAHAVEALGPLVGIAVWRLRVEPDGTVGEASLLAHTLVSRVHDARDPESALHAMREQLLGLRFPPSDEGAAVTLPVTVATR